MPKSNDHHNTTGLTGVELEAKRTRAKGQDLLVLDFFLARPAGRFSACQVWREIRNPAAKKPILLTSVRRSCSNLKNRELLVKTDFRIVGFYNDTVGTYQLAPPQTKEQGKLFKNQPGKDGLVGKYT
jgi:hypothetical protein